MSGPFGPLAQGSLLARRAPRPVTAPVFVDEPRTPWLEYTNEQLRSGCVVLLDVSGASAQPLSVLPPGEFGDLGDLPPGRERVAVAQVPLTELRAAVGDAALVRLLSATRVTLVAWYVDIDDFTAFARFLPGYRTVVRDDDAVAAPLDRAPPSPQPDKKDSARGVDRPVPGPPPGFAGAATKESARREEPARRVLHAVVAGTDGVALTAAVPPAGPFLLRLRVSRPVVENNPPPARGWDLVVLATSDDIPLDDRPRLLHLPAGGESWSCACPAGLFEHRCGPADRTDWLDLDAAAPGRPGEARITVRVYFGAVLVQAAEIVIPVGLADRRPRSEIVYSRDPEMLDLDALDHRGLSCHLTPSPGGRHTLVVNNGYNQPIRVAFADRPGDAAAAELRRALRDTQLDAARPRHRFGPQGQPVKSRDEYLADLRGLAGAGATAYRALLSGHENEQRLRHWLGTEVLVTGAPPVIQVARSATARISVPWQALYAEPLATGPPADGPDPLVCPSVWEWGPGGSTADPPPRCPYRDRHDPETGTICPFGFWGLANVLEHPPSSLTRVLPRTTGVAPPPEMIAAVDPALPGHRDHLSRVATVVGDRALSVTTSWRDLRAAAAEGADVLYFLGQSLDSWSSTAHCERRRPLVILNDCDIRPELLAGLVDAFVSSLCGAGVIATEIAVESRAAQYAAETLLGRLWSGDTAGDALRAMRWRLLGFGSVLGLAYTPFCDAFLTLPATFTG